MNPNDITLTITDIQHGPVGIAEVAGRKYHIKGGLPGDQILGYVSRRRGGIHTVKVKELLTPAPARTASDCEHFPACGGCSWRNLHYQDQLHYKLAILNNELKSHGIEQTCSTIQPAPELHYYRNKMELTFGTDDLGNVIVGMHKKENFSQIIHTRHCKLQSPQSNMIADIVTDWANSHEITSYNPRTHTGDLRHLVIREGKNTNQCLVGLVSTREDLPELQDLIDRLWAQIPHLSGLLLILNTSLSDTVNYEKSILLNGQSTFTEALNNKTYTLSLPSFFQTNTLATLHLYEAIKSITTHFTGSTLLDLYCGAGSIGIYCAEPRHQIYGVEINQDAINDAVRNLNENHLEKIQYICGDVKDFLKSHLDLLPQALGIIDPPREGLHPKTRNLLLEMDLPELIYVSCNPRTLAIDLETLHTKYRIKSMQAFDLFPFTPHMETIVLLEK